MSFENLTPAQLGAFILGILFSIFAVVGILIALKQTNKLKLTTSVLLALLAAPFAAFVCWFYLIFSFTPGFLNKDFLSFMVALIVALIVCIMIITVTMMLYKKRKSLMTQDEISQIADELDEEDNFDKYEIEDVKTAKNIDEQIDYKNQKVEKIDYKNEQIKEEKNQIVKEEVLNEQEFDEEGKANKNVEIVVEPIEQTNAIEEVKNDNNEENLTLEEPPVNETESVVENNSTLEETNEEETENISNVENEEKIQEEVVDKVEEKVDDEEEFDEDDLDAKFAELLEMLKNESEITNEDHLDDLADDIIDEFQADIKKKDDKKDDE